MDEGPAIPAVKIGVKLQPPLGGIALQQFGEVRLEERQLASPQFSDLVRVGVDTDYMVADFCET
jgi:hypothetical protein